MPRVAGVSNETIDAWTELRESSLNALSNDEQEVDMERIDAKIGRALNASSVALPAFNESNYDSQLDYLTEMIRRAKLAPYAPSGSSRQPGVQTAWRADSLPTHRHDLTLRPLARRP